MEENNQKAIDLLTEIMLRAANTINEIKFPDEKLLRKIKSTDMAIAGQKLIVFNAYLDNKQADISELITEFLPKNN